MTAGVSTWWLAVPESDDDVSVELPTARMNERLSSEYLEFNGVLPLGFTGDRLQLGAWRDRVDAQVIDDMELLFDAYVDLHPISESTGRQLARKLYGDEDVSARGVIADLESSGQLEVHSLDSDAFTSAGPLDDLVSLANEAPVVKLVNLLLVEALEARASDVHLEGYADGLRVRYRIDGVLQDAPSPPAQMTAAIVSRLKIMAELDVAERRLPQDGRIRLALQDRHVDVRVSTIPTLRGESVVLRLLDKERGRISLDQLGMPSETLAQFRSVISRPHGIVLVTGPTGSGKTTTLYAAIDHIRTGREKIITVEDPVEYQLSGVPQIPVNEKVGVTFASALRAMLRQDPDVMLVGEIRDRETAAIAVQAAMTGHLVLSTLHTNDAWGALLRLADLGVDDSMSMTVVEGVLAQRLVRVNCRHCVAFVDVSSAERALLGSFGVALEHVSRGRGCEKCRGTGYLGRTGIYELLLVDDALRGERLRRPSAREKPTSSRSLVMEALRLVSEGVTTPEEIARVVTT